MTLVERNIMLQKSMKEEVQSLKPMIEKEIVNLNDRSNQDFNGFKERFDKVFKDNYYKTNKEIQNYINEISK